MSLSGEQRPIDVTTLPPRQDHPSPPTPIPPVPLRQDSPPPPPPRKVAWLSGVVLSALGNWLERPRVRTVLFALSATIAVGVVVARSRPPSIDGPALSTSGWRASASDLGRTRRLAPDPGAALDGNPNTDWTTGRGQRNSDWFAVDMGRRQTFHQVVLDAGSNANAYPRAYAVYVSGDGVHWGVSVANGAGQGPMTIVGFAPQTARYIKIVQTGQDRHSPWSLCEFTVH